MKAVKMLEFIKAQEGVELDLSKLDLSGLETEWNRQVNGMKKAHGEEVESNTKKMLFESLGVENQEDLKKKLDLNKDTDTKNNEALEELKKQIETMKADLASKDNAIQREKQIAGLGNITIDGKVYKIQEDKREKAHLLITNNVTEENPYENEVVAFVKSTPEWLEGNNKREINLGGQEKNDPNLKGEAKVDDFW